MTLFKAKETPPIEAAKHQVYKADGRCQGDRLMQAKRNARVETAKGNHAAAVTAKAAALKVHRESDSDDAFDPAPFDAEIAKWQAELDDRVAIAAKQDEVVAEGLRLQATAKNALLVEVRKVVLVERQTVLEQLLTLNERVGELDNQIGGDRFVLTFLPKETVDNVGVAVALHVKPTPKVAPSELPLNAIRIVVDNWSDGRCNYGKGEGVCLKSAAMAAEAVARGHAVYQFVDDEQPALIAAAKVRISQRDADRSGFLSIDGAHNG